MPNQISADDIFAIHPKIRWAGLATRRGRIIFMKMREGVASQTPESTDRLTVELRANYMIETAEQESKWGGPLHHIAIVFEKYVEIVTPLKDSYVVITVESDLPSESYSAICQTIRTLAENRAQT